ncbi:MAG: EamA family transporter [Candidatus Omnitrophica bacterium]|nr:EamA family transporter [Candidatus Omnitrophota bacterium]
MSKIILLVLIAEFWIIIGQVCFKKSADRLNARGKGPKTWVLHLLGSISRTPTIWIGAAAMFVGMLFWFAALSSGELSYVYLLGSIQYIIALVAAHFFLNEKINKSKLIGTLLITLGIILTIAS